MLSLNKSKGRLTIRLKGSGYRHEKKRPSVKALFRRYGKASGDEPYASLALFQREPHGNQAGIQRVSSAKNHCFT